MLVSVDYLPKESRTEFIPMIVEMFRVWCDREFGFYLYDWQIEFATEFFESMFVSREDIALQVARQAGKTEDVTLLLRFCMNFYYSWYGREPFMCGISSPKGEQAKTDIDRIKKSINLKRDAWKIEDRENNANTIRAYKFNRLISEMYKFSLAKGTSNESKTIVVSVVEEAHKTDDEKRQDEIDAMLTDTDGFTVFIGVGNIQNCDFYRGVVGEREGTKALVFDCDRVIADRQKAYEATGEIKHLRYKKTVEKERKKKGSMNPSFRRNYKLENMIEVSDYISMARLQSHRRKHCDCCMDTGYYKNDEGLNIECGCVSVETLFLGVDFGKSIDRTVATVMNEYYDILDWIVISDMPDFEDQAKVIQEQCKKRGYFDNIVSVRLDATAMGGAAQIFQKYTDFPCGEESHVVFGTQTKNAMYTELDTRLFKDSDASPKTKLSYPGEHEHAETFEHELTNLQRIYKGDGEYLVPSHKEGDDWHDDFPDSVALVTIGATGGGIGDIITSDSDEEDDDEDDDTY